MPFYKGAYADGVVSPQYARVMSGDVMFYRSDSGSEENENRYFLLPDGYFVYLDNAAQTEYYKITYDGMSGYVKAAAVDIVSFVPKLKYASGQTLKIGLVESPFCYFREFPSTDANKLADGIPDGAENIKFFGHINVGAERWYYIAYGGLTGYVRGDLTVITNQIAVNDGAAEPALEIIDPGNSGNKSPKSSTPLSITTIIILIAVIAIPAIVIMFLLFKPKRRRPAYRPLNRDTDRIPRYLDEGYSDKDGR